MNITQAPTTKNKLSPRLVIFIIIVAIVATTLYIVILLATVSSSSTSAADDATGQSDRPVVAAARPQTEGGPSDSVDLSENTSGASAEEASPSDQGQDTSSANQPRIPQNQVQPSTEREDNQNNTITNDLPLDHVPVPDKTIKPDNQNNEPKKPWGPLNNSLVRANDNGVSSELLDIEIGS